MKLTISSVQSLSLVQLFATPWTAACLVSLSNMNFQNLLKLMSFASVMPSTISSSVVPFSSCLQSFPASGSFLMNQLFSLGGRSTGVSASAISPSSEYSGLISFRIDWLDLLAVQGTLKSLLQHHSSKASILCLSAFYMVQLSHPYMATRKTIALTIWNFFNMLSRLVKAFLPRSKRLLTARLRNLSAVILQSLFPRLFAMK